MNNFITLLSHLAVTRILKMSIVLILITLILLIASNDADAINLYPEASETLGKTLNPNNDIPKNKFKAFYFDAKNPTEVVSSEITEVVSVNYSWANFNNISSSSFGGYWVGEFDFKESTPKTFITYLSHSKVRLIIDNHVIYEGGSSKIFNYTFSKGSHKIEVEFYNGWHTTNFFLGIRDLKKTFSMKNIKSAFDLEEIKHTKIYIGNKKNSQNSRYKNIRVETTDKPVIIYLPDEFTNFIVENNDNINLIGVIHSERSVVHFNGKPTKVIIFQAPHEFSNIFGKIHKLGYEEYTSRFYNIVTQSVFGIPFGGLPDESSSNDVYFVEYPMDQNFLNETEADFVKDAVLSGNKILFEFAVAMSQLNKDPNPEVITMLKSLEDFNDPERTSIMSKLINYTRYYGHNHEYKRFHEQLKIIEEKELQTLPAFALGEKLFNKSCNNCHSIDGIRRVGPSFKGLYNSTRYLADGTKVKADEEYLIESIINPVKKIVKNYPATCFGHIDENGQINEREVRALVKYIKSL